MSTSQVGHVLFAAVGAAVLTYEAYIWFRIVRIKHRTGERFSQAERIAAAAVRGKYLALGGALMAIGVEGRAAVTAALATVVVVFLASRLVIWWVARTLPESG